MRDFLIDDIQSTTDESLINLGVLSTDAIALSDDQINQARFLSQRVVELEDRWQVYLNALALIGFEAWLHQRSSDIAFNSQFSRVVQSSTRAGVTAICNVVANHFKLCLIGIGITPDADLAIPTAAIDQDDCIAHFYIPIQVYEELGHILIAGFLTSDQLNQHCETTGLQASSNNTYCLPFTWFKPDVARLLLQLSCLTPTAISLPVPEPQTKPSPLYISHF